MRIHHTFKITLSILLLTAQLPPAAHAQNNTTPSDTAVAQTDSGTNAAFERGREAYRNKQWFAALGALRPLAERGDSRAMVLVANMYNDGAGVMRNRARAINMYRDAAALNNTEAMIAIAAMYQSGQVVKKNAKMASAWFHRAALLGNQAGAFFYAISRFQGDLSGATDLTQDMTEAYKWFLIASRIEGGYAHMRQAARMTAASIANRLSLEERVAANRTAVVWRPITDPKRLGPLPDNPDSPLLEEIKKSVAQEKRYDSLTGKDQTAPDITGMDEDENLPPLQNVTAPEDASIPPAAQ